MDEDRAQMLKGICLWLAAALSAAALAAQIAGNLGQAAFHWDGRYSMAAADCVAAGQSPYDPAAFFGCWEARTGTPARSTYVFPPEALLPALPMAGVGRPAADAILLGWQALAFGAMTWWAVLLLGAAPARGWTAAGWLALALTNTGVFGSVYLGQLSLAAGAGVVGLALAVTATKTATATGAGRRPWVGGLVLAFAKPHLTVLAALGALVGTGRVDGRRKAVALAVLAAANLWIFALDPAFLDHAREALALHAESRYSSVSTPEELFGLPGFLATLTGEWAVATALACLGLAAAAVGLRRLARPGETPQLAAFAALVIAGAMLVPHKPYDFAVYTVAFLAAARQPLAVQALLLAPLLVVWRPALLELIGADVRMGTNLCLLALSAAFAALALAAWKAERGARG